MAGAKIAETSADQKKERKGVPDPETRKPEVSSESRTAVTIKNKGDTLIGSLRLQSIDHVQSLWASGYYGPSKGPINWKVVAERTALDNQHRQGANKVSVGDTFRLPELSQKAGVSEQGMRMEPGVREARQLTEQGLSDIRGQSPDYSKGQDKLQEAVRMNPQDPGPYLGLAEAQIKQGRYDNAGEYIKLALEKGGERGKEGVDRMLLQAKKEAEQKEKNGDVVGAEGQLEFIHGLSPQVKGVKEDLGRAKIRMAEEYFSSGQLAQAKQKISEARQLGSPRVEQDLRQAGIKLYDQARGLIRSGDLQGSVRLIDQALVLNPDGPKTRVLGAQLHFGVMKEHINAGKQNEAMEEALRVRQLTEGLSGREATRLYNRAEESYRSIGLERAVGSVYQQAEQLASRGMWSQAESKYEAGIRMGDKSYRPWLAIAELRADGHGEGVAVSRGGRRRKGETPAAPVDNSGVRSPDGVLNKALTLIPPTDVEGWKKAVTVAIKCRQFEDTAKSLLAAIDSLDHAGNKESATKLREEADRLAHAYIGGTDRVTLSGK